MQLSPIETLGLAILASLALSLVALVVYHRRVVAPRERELLTMLDAALESPSGGLRAVRELVRGDTDDRLAALELKARERDLRLGFVRYNSFADVGSDLSYSLALVSDRGDGIVLTSIYSREETRTYGKSVENWSTTQGASDEERGAIERARTGPGVPLATS